MTKNTPERLQYAKEYREKHRDKIIQYLRDYHKDPINKEVAKEKKKVYLTPEKKQELYSRVKAWTKANPNKFQFNQVKCRAKANKIPFDLEFDELVWPTTCPILGVEIHRAKRDNHPSFDRIDPLKGYTKGNVCIISNRANRMKQDASLSDIKAIYEYVLYNTKQQENIDQEVC